MNSIRGWHDYAEDLLPAHFDTFLDYGCGSGAMLRRVVDRCKNAFGVDVDPDVLPSDPRVLTLAIKEGERLPFPDGYFDVVTCLEVIEHVADERWTLRELARVLKNDGTLILTTPHRGLLTWMDPGNIKFAFPRLHRLSHKLLGNRNYETQFGERRKNELRLISDISANQENPWHRHYFYEEIRALADGSLETDLTEVWYPGMRAFWCVHIIWTGAFGSAPRWLHPFISALSRRRTRLGDQLVIRFRKRAGEQPGSGEFTRGSQGQDRCRI